MGNNHKCWCECKKCHVCKKDYVWNVATGKCGNGKYLESIMDDSAITCDEIIESRNKDKNAKAKWMGHPKLFNKSNLYEKKATCKTRNLYILLAVSLINISLLIAVSIYCYLIKYHAKQLLLFQYTNN